MNKRIMAVCDTEQEYAYRLTEYLAGEAALPFEVCLLTDGKQLQAYAESHVIEVLLVSESVYRAGIGNLKIPYLVMLSEGGQTAAEGVKSIGKYQSSEMILQELMCYYTQQEEWLPDRLRTAAHARLIGVYTPIGRCLQTTFSLTLGQLLAREHKTLYLNFESYSGLGRLLERESRKDLSDLLYYFECSRERFFYRFPGIVQSVNGLDYIPPVKAYTELRAVKGSRWPELFKELAAAGDYEYLLMDLTENLDGLFEILRQCDKVYTLTREDSFAAAKLEQYEELLRLWDYGDVAGKTRKWSLPEFSRIPGGLERLTYGDLAEYIKKTVLQELYG